MKRTLFALGWVCASLAGPRLEAQAEAVKPAVTVLRAARLFDGKGDAVLADAVVVIENGRIRAVGKNPPIPPGAEVIDLGDSTLLPGFIDCHTHVTGESGDDWAASTIASMRRTVPETTLHAAVYAKRLLEAGFTTIRDLGSGDWVDVGLREAIAAGVAVGPTIVPAGHALGARGGHCDGTGFPEGFFGDEPGVPDGIASGPEAFRDAVRYQVKYGAGRHQGVRHRRCPVARRRGRHAAAVRSRARGDRRRGASTAQEGGGARPRRERRQVRHSSRRRFDRARLVSRRRGARHDEEAGHLPGADAARRRIRRRAQSNPEVSARDRREGQSRGRGPFGRPSARRSPRE